MQPYFRQASDSDGIEIALGDPLGQRSDGTQIVLSRRSKRSDGSLAGVVAATLNPRLSPAVLLHPEDRRGGRHRARDEQRHDAESLDIRPAHHDARHFGYLRASCAPLALNPWFFRLRRTLSDLPSPPSPSYIK